jgi:hypothetical protein
MLFFPDFPVKSGRDKGKILRQTYIMSNRYKGIMQTSIIIFCCLGKIDPIEVSWHNIIITPFIMVWQKYNLDRNPKILGKMVWYRNG